MRTAAMKEQQTGLAHLTPGQQLDFNSVANERTAVRLQGKRSIKPPLFFSFWDFHASYEPSEIADDLPQTCRLIPGSTLR
jgi:hypothetical protein